MTDTPLSHHKRSPRDRIVERLTTEYGVLQRYKSGRIIHIDHNGKRTDVLQDLHDRIHSPRLWKCFRLQGGGTVDYPDHTRASAMARCAAELGGVIYTDDQHGFIFFRDRAAPASVTIPSEPISIKE